MSRHRSTPDSATEQERRTPNHTSLERRTFDGIRTVDGQTTARAVLAQYPRQFVVVVRGAPRSAVFRCPCGCGDTVAINLDRAVGPAWRLRIDDEGVTLMPSVLRISGCRSHFVVWHNVVWWCRSRDEMEPSDADQEELEDWPAEMDVELRDEWRRIRAERASRRR